MVELTSYKVGKEERVQGHTLAGHVGLVHWGNTCFSLSKDVADVALADGFVSVYGMF